MRLIMRKNEIEPCYGWGCRGIEYTKDPHLFENGKKNIRFKVLIELIKLDSLF